MTRKLLKLFSTFIVCLPASAFALGLGQIQVRSALNQRLDAQIPILAADEEELTVLKARLATPQMFAQRDVERLPLLTSLEFSVETDQAGRSFIQVSSKQPIREPLLNFLLEADWSSGQLVREYVVLLDLPTVVMRQPATPAIAVTAEPTADSIPAEPVLDANARHKGSVTYGPVAYGETLWDIAQRLRPDPSISRERMMQALLEANPQAFYQPDVDSLSAGETLRVPSAQELDPERFSDSVSRQLAQQQAASAATSLAATAATNDAGVARVRLVPPDVDRTADMALATSETPRANTPASVLAPSERIALEDDRPQLQVAGMTELRERLDLMAQEDALGQIDDVERALESTSAATVQELQNRDGGRAGVEPETAAQEQPLADAATPSLKTQFQEAIPQVSLLPQLEESLQEEAAESDPLPQAFEEAVPGGIENESLATAPVEPAQEQIAALQPQLPAVALVAEPEQTLDDPSAGSQGGAKGLLQDPIKLTLIGFTSLLLLGLPLFVRARRANNADEEELAFADVPPEPVTIKESSEPQESIEQPTKTEYLAKTAPAESPAEATAETGYNPLEEADTLLAVGNYGEAKGIVRKALLKAPGDSDLAAKLMDIHYAAGDADAFAKDAETLRPMFGAESDPRWAQVARMGRELCPNATLFAKSPEFAASDSLQASQNNTGEPTTALNLDAGLPFELTKDSADPVSAPRVSQPTREQETSDTGDDALEWQLPDIEPPTVATSDLPDEEPAQAPQDDPEAQLKNLDFEFDEIANTGKTVADDALSLDAIQANALSNGTAQERTEYVDKAEMESNFDFSLDSSDESLAAAESLEEENASANYVETKLDLAMAYIDMGDSVGARSLLEEVMREGSGSQKERAEQCMAKLG